MRAWEPFLKVEGWGSGFVGVDRALKHYMGETRSEHTRQNFCDTLMRFLRFADLDPDEAVGLGRDEASELVQGYVDHLAGRGLGIGTVNTALAYLTVFFRVNGFVGEKELEVERRQQPTRYRKRPEYVPAPQEIYKMASSSGSKRNRAIVLALYTSGLRNSTLRAVRIGDVLDELEAGLEAIRLPVYPEMKALVADACKGRIPYYSFISHGAVDALRDYLDERRERYGGLSSEEPLFCADSPSYDPELSRVTPVKKRTLAEMVKRAARRAGVDRWKDVSPRCLRKAFESALRNNRLDLKDQEFLMGHNPPGSRDAYYDGSETENLRRKHSDIVFFPERSAPDEALRRKQAVLDSAKLQGYDDEALRMLEETIEGAENIDEGIEEFRKIRDYTKNRSIYRALEELRDLFDIQNIPVNHVASHPDVRMSPERTRDALYHIGWREPSKNEEEQFHIKYEELAERAWLLENEPDEREYTQEGIKKLRCFLILYPDSTKRGRPALF